MPKTIPYGCPHCESTEGFTEADTVQASADIVSFDESGQPIFAGASEIDWNSQKLDLSNAEPCRCDACGKSFAKPLPIPRRTKQSGKGR